MRCWTKLIGLLAAVVFLGNSISAQATVLWEEAFDYADSSAIASQGDWTATSNGTVTSGLTYPNLLTSGGAMSDLGAGLSSATLPAAANDIFTTNGTYYVTYLLETATVNNQAIWRSPAAGGGDFFISSNRGGQTGQLETPGAGTQTGPGSVISTTNVNLIAMRFVNQAGNEEITMAVNPDLSLGEPVWASELPVISNYDLTKPAAIAQKLDLSSTSTAWDEFRIATTWAEAAPADIPEPGTLSLIALGALCLVPRKRR